MTHIICVGVRTRLSSSFSTSLKLGCHATTCVQFTGRVRVRARARVRVRVSFRVRVGVRVRVRVSVRVMRFQENC